MRPMNLALICVSLVVLAAIFTVPTVLPHVVTLRVDTTYAVRHDTVWTAVESTTVAGIPPRSVVCKTPLGTRIYAEAYVSNGYNVRSRIDDRKLSAGDSWVSQRNHVYCEQT